VICSRESPEVTGEIGEVFDIGQCASRCGCINAVSSGRSDVPAKRVTKISEAEMNSHPTTNNAARAIGPDEKISGELPRCRSQLPAAVGVIRSFDAGTSQFRSCVDCSLPHHAPQFSS